MSKNSTKIQVSQHVDETDFLVVDVETTGLSAERGDRVCEVAAVKLRGGAIVETFTSLINPRQPISAGAYAVNRISPAMLADEPEFSEIADKLSGLMNDTVLVAYNAPFDMGFFRSEFRLAGYPAFTNTTVDALALARQLLPGLPKYSQTNVAEVVGIPFPVKHRALEDTITTAKLFMLFLSILKAHDMTTTDDLTRKDLGNVLQTKRVTIVKEAMAIENNLWIKYLSPTNAEITDRVITPKDLSDERPPRLSAFCHVAQAERNFRIDRMLDVRMIKGTTI